MYTYVEIVYRNGKLTIIYYYSFLVQASAKELVEYTDDKFFIKLFFVLIL
jgi:hypothetical protein